MSQEGISMMEGILEEAEIDPAECQDPLLGQLTGGMLEDVMEDSVMGATADGVSITAYPMDSRRRPTTTSTACAMPTRTAATSP